ncbi:hypothetical protein MASR2M79_12790 [Aminivibrio sp.]
MVSPPFHTPAEAGDMGIHWKGRTPEVKEQDTGGGLGTDPRKGEKVVPDLIGAPFLTPRREYSPKSL